MHTKSTKDATAAKQSSERPPVFILLEDDFLHKRLWKMEARANCVPLIEFDNVEDLLTAEPNLPEECVFLLDNDLGPNDRDAGRAVAAEIRKRRKAASIILQTHHDQSTFEVELGNGVIDAVFGKEPNILKVHAEHRKISNENENRRIKQ